MVQVDNSFIDYSSQSIKSEKSSLHSTSGGKEWKQSKSSRSVTAAILDDDEDDDEDKPAREQADESEQEKEATQLARKSSRRSSASRKSAKAASIKSKGYSGKNGDDHKEDGDGPRKDGFAVPKDKRTNIASVVSDSPPVINYSRKTSTVSKTEAPTVSRAAKRESEQSKESEDENESDDDAVIAPARTPRGALSKRNESGSESEEEDDEDEDRTEVVGRTAPKKAVDSEEDEAESDDGHVSPMPSSKPTFDRRRSSQAIPARPPRRIASPALGSETFSGPGQFDSSSIKPAGPNKLRRKSNASAKYAGAAATATGLAAGGTALARSYSNGNGEGGNKLQRRKSTSSQRPSIKSRNSNYEDTLAERDNAFSDDEDDGSRRRKSRSSRLKSQSSPTEERSPNLSSMRPKRDRRQSVVSFSRVDIEYDEDDEDLKQRGSSKSYGHGAGIAKTTSTQEPEPKQDVNSLDLTPQDRHYLNRMMINLEIQREGSALSQIGSLTTYKQPFLPHPNGPNSRPSHLSTQSGGLLGMVGLGGGGPAKRQPGFENYEWEEGSNVDPPILRYLFYRFLYNAPVLREAKPEYWTERIQPFWDSFLERDLSTTAERSEVTKRRLLSMGLTRVLGTYASTCLPAQGRTAPARPSVTVMRRIDHLVPGSMDSLWRTFRPNEEIAYNAWTAIVSEEPTRGETAFLVVSRVLVVEGGPTYLVLRRWSAFIKLAQNMDELDPANSLNLPLLPTASADDPPSRSHAQQYLRLLVISLSSPPSHLRDSQMLSEARSKLEAFLLGSAEKASLRELEEWVIEGEKDEMKADRLREQWVRVGRRGKKLRTTWSLYRTALISGTEIDKSIAIVKRTSQLKALPESYRDAEEWARIWVAYMFHYFFISNENGAEILALLKSFHDLIPYAALKLGLSLVNPTLAIRAIVQIMLGQPVGQASLFQRIFAIVCNGGIKQQKKLAAQYRARINNDSLCQALEKHVYSPFQVRAATRAEAEKRGEEIVITIMRRHGSEYEVKMLKEWYSEYKSRGAANTAIDDSSKAGKFQNVKGLLAAICRQRDREQVVGIIMESNTPKTLHDSISVFYKTIYKVAEAANLSQRLGDLQAFLDDLIEVAYSEKNSPPDFIALAGRHDQQLYYLVHELASNGGTLLDPLIDWSKSGLTFIREGVPPVNKPKRRGSTSSRRKGGNASGAGEATRAGVDFDALIAEQPEKAKKAIVGEVRALARWTSYRKAYADISLRVDLLRVEHPDSNSAAGAWAASLDKSILYEDLLLQDREVMDLLVTRDDSPMEWAWFGEVEELGGLLVDWRLVDKIEKSVAEKRRREQGKPARRGLFRKSSSATTAHEEDFEETKKSAIQMPAPEVRAAKSLLPRFVENLAPALDSARENGIKS